MTISKCDNCAAEITEQGGDIWCEICGWYSMGDGRTGIMSAEELAETIAATDLNAE